VTFAASLLDEMFNEQRRAQQQQQAGRRNPAQEPARGGQDQGQARGRRPEPAQEEEPEPELPGMGLFGSGSDDIRDALRTLEGEESVRVVANKQQNTLIIRARTEDFPDIMQLLNKIDRPSTVAAREYKIVELANIGAQEAKAMVEDLLQIGDDSQRGARPVQRRVQQRPGQGGAGRGGSAAEQLAQQMLDEELQLGPEGQRVSKSEISIAAMPATNSVVIFGPPGPREQIVTIVKELDEAWGKDDKVVAFVLKKADAVSLAKTLNEAFQLGSAAGAEGTSGRASSKTVSITADEASNTIYVVAPKHLREEIGKRIDEAETQAGELATPKIIEVRQGDAEAIAEKLNEIFAPQTKGSKKVQITGDKLAKRIFVTAPSEIFEQVKLMTAEMDQPSDELLPVHYALKFAQASDVKQRMVDMVLMLARSLKEQGVNVEMGGFAVMDDPRTNSLIVMGSKKTHLLVTTALSRIDIEPPPEARRSTLTIQLASASAREVADNLRKLFPDDPRGGKAVDAPRIEANEAGNAVIVEGTQQQLDQINALVKNLDGLTPGQTRKFIVVKVEHGDATQIARTVQDLTQAQAQARGGAQRGPGPTVTADAGSNVVILYANEAESLPLKAIIADMDQEGATAASGAPQRITLKHISPAQTADLLTEVFTKPIEQEIRQQSSGRGPGSQSRTVPLIMADEATKSLIVRAQEKDYQEIKRMVDDLDKEDAEPMASGMKIIRVGEGVDVQELARMLENTIQEGERAKQQQNKAYQPKSVAIGADERTGTLLVSGSPVMFDEVESIVNQLKEMKPAGKASVRIINLGGMKPDEVKAVLDKLIQGQQPGRQPGGGGRRPQGR
jgi:type II secretory pathway component GspD/PulD (secretin)